MRPFHKKRSLLLETLESRELKTGDIGALANQFNYGMLTLRTKADEVAIEGFSNDLPKNMPIVEEENLASAMGAPAFIRQLFSGSIRDASSLEAAINDLKSQGFSIAQFSTDVDAKGDYFRMTKSYTTTAPTDFEAQFEDLEGFKYFQSSKGDLTGGLHGSVGKYTGTITIGLDQNGFYFDSKSKIAAQSISATGRVSSERDIGVLQDVDLNGIAKLAGNINVTFVDVDRDGKLRVGQLGDSSVVNGAMRGNVSLTDVRFQGNIPGITTVKWTGGFTATVAGAKLTATETLVAPSYSSILSSLKLGFVENLKQLDWVKKLDGYLDVQVPYLDKSIGQLLDTEEVVDKAMKAIGVTTLPSGSQAAAMNKLIRGQNVDLVSFKKDFDIELGSWDLIDPVKLVDFKWGGGVVSASLEASVTADLALTANIDIGVGSRGFWINDTTSIGIKGGIQGTLEGKVELFWIFKALSAKGSLGLASSVQLRLTSPVAGQSRLYTAELGETKKEVVDRLTELMSLDFVVALQVKAKAKFFGKVVFDENHDLAKLVDIHVGPKSGNIKPRVATAPAFADESSIEGESLELIGKSASNVQLTKKASSTPGLYRNDQLLAVRTSGNGWVEFNIPSDSAGQYQLQLLALRNNRQSALRVFWNGQQAGNSVDLFQSTGAAMATLDFGVVDILEGSNTLRIELLDGASTLDDAFREIGIDGIDLYDLGARGNAPKAVENLQAVNRWTTAIDLNWLRQNDATYYRVEQRLGGQWNTVQQISGAVSQVRLAQLSPGVEYAFRVIAVNSAGASEGREIRVKTRVELPSSPSDLRIENRFATAIDLKWNDLSSNESEFRVAFSTDGVNWNHAGYTAANATTYRVTSLNPNTHYWFKVRAANEEGYSNYSNSVEVTTRDSAPAAPSDLRIENRFATAIDLKWNDLSSNETEFRVAVSTDGVNWNHAGSTAANDTSIRVTGLNPSTRYWFKVRAANSEGYSDYSNTLDTTTRGLPPDAPSGLVAANIWANQVDLNWNDQSGNESGFRIEISTDGVNWQTALQVEANRVNARISGLTSKRNYSFRVVAFNDEGQSGSSNVIAVRTK